MHGAQVNAVRDRGTDHSASIGAKRCTNSGERGPQAGDAAARLLVVPGSERLNHAVCTFRVHDASLLFLSTRNALYKKNFLAILRSHCIDE
jgi:hypothetical protein